MGRVVTDGKQFALDGRRFRFAGVTYGTFAARSNGELYPDTRRVSADFEMMHDRGFTVARTYTAPPDDVIAAATDADMRLLAGVFHRDWRYSIESGRRERRRVMRDARVAVAETARRLTGCEHVVGISLGNEIPADAVRWFGASMVEQTLAELADAVRDIDPDMLVTYGNYPTTEYLDLDTLDFVTFNVFLERRNDLRRYLTRLHHLAGDRPVVLGEMGLHAGHDDAGARQQADVVGWQLETAMERGIAGTCVFSWTDDWVVGGNRVDDWHFGLTRADRSPRPALDVAEMWNRRTVADIEHLWPALSVVICAYNAEETIDECLAHTCALDYPNLDVVVINDGSTDDTAAIVSRHQNARLVSVPHSGLGVARNAGIDAARHDLIAYLDSDAYPSPEWPFFLALGLNSHTVGAVGGPNIPPATDPPGAHIVARAPGGPVHVLLGDDRAEHVPGCNMAFWRYALGAVGGFDPIFTSAGDDVDVCWKILDHGLEIGFHPAALVWHHRRPTIRTYFRQQRGYGRSEALVESRHPDRYNALGTARWHGRIYNPAAPRAARQNIYRGPYGVGAYQSVYGAGGHAVDVAYQVGVPVAVASLVTLAALPVMLPVAVPGIVGALYLLAMFLFGVARTSPPRRFDGSDMRFRLTVAILHLGQPLVRLWGRHHRNPASPPATSTSPPLPPVRRVGRHHVVFAAERPREELAAGLVGRLRTAGLRVLPVNAWDDVDATIIASALVVGHLVTSGHPDGYHQLRVDSRLRRRRVLVWGAAAVALTPIAWPLAAVVVVACLASIGRGWRAVTRTAWGAVTSGVVDVQSTPNTPTAEAPEMSETLGWPRTAPLGADDALVLQR